MLARLSPSNISSVVAAVEADGVTLSEYRFRWSERPRYRNSALGRKSYTNDRPFARGWIYPIGVWSGACCTRDRERIWTLSVSARAL